MTHFYVLPEKLSKGLERRKPKFFSIEFIQPVGDKLIVLFGWEGQKDKERNIFYNWLYFLLISNFFLFKRSMLLRWITFSFNYSSFKGQFILLKVQEDHNGMHFLQQDKMQQNHHFLFHNGRRKGIELTPWTIIFL